MRSFNTTGPVFPDKHYSIPPLERIDLDRILNLIHQEKYFSLHAPRQTGKTSILLALQNLLNGGSKEPYRCVYVNVEAGQTAREDVGRAMRTILGRIGSRASQALGDDFVASNRRQILEQFGPDEVLQEALTQWARANQNPLVLLIDEIDALIGDTLLAVLRQLRSGYDLRPNSFPHSIILCGVRDLRTYRTFSSSEGQSIAGGSAFNISAGSLRLGDFSRPEVEVLLGQHSAEIGQEVLPAALERIWAQTQGQPWLVNGLCNRVCSQPAIERNQPITEEAVIDAQEELILERVVHLDQLADKLREDRVRRVIEPLLSGASDCDFHDQDYEYVRDLGLVAADEPLRMANPIYAEVVPRQLTFVTQLGLQEKVEWYVNDRGGLQVAALLEAFRDFFRQHSEHWLGSYDYKEAGPQLLLQAFLQRVVNGGGRIEREYGLGMRRTDLLIVWPQADGVQRFVIECKILRDSLETTIRKGVAQTSDYMDKCAADEGHLVIFDRSGRRWQEKVFRRRETFSGTPVEVWGT